MITAVRVAVWHHTRVSQYCWLCSLCFALLPHDHFYNWQFVLFLSLTPSLPSPQPPAHLATINLFFVSICLFVHLFSHIFIHLSVDGNWVCFHILAILNNTATNIGVLLICMSLMTNDVEHIFMYLSAVCMSSLEKCLFRSFSHFKSDGCLFLFVFCYWVVWFLTLFFDINLSSDINFLMT